MTTKELESELRDLSSAAMARGFDGEAEVLGEAADMMDRLRVLSLGFAKRHFFFIGPTMEGWVFQMRPLGDHGARNFRRGEDGLPDMDPEAFADLKAAVDS